MPGFASLDQVLNATTVELRGQTLLFSKRLPVASVVGIPHTTWIGSGNPSEGETPTAGLGGAVVCTSATAGALKYTNPGGSRTMHLLSTSLYSTPALGSWILVDRIAHANITNNQGTGSFSPVIDATSRLASGEGAQIFMEVTSTLSASTNIRTFTYTNQDGTGSRVTPSFTSVSSAVVGRVPIFDYLWLPLQAGDTGVRSIESTTLVSGTATGNYNIALMRPLTPLISTSLVSGMMTDRDFVTEFPLLSRIRDNSCLQWIFIPVSAATYSVHGEVRIAEN